MSVFNSTPNTFNDFFFAHKERIEENKRNHKPYDEGLSSSVKQISMDSRISNDIQFGEKTQISKSNIGRRVVVG